MKDRLELIEQMLKENAHDEFLLYAAALEFKKRDNLEKAEELFLQILSFSPEYLPVYYQLGKLYEQKNNIKEAETTYRKGIELANAKGDQKAMGELSEALMMVEE